MEHLLKAALDPVLEALARRPGDACLVADLAERARPHLRAEVSRWGVRHGDISPDNTHRSPDGLVLFDCDQCGPGPLAADLVGVRATDHWTAFAHGYRRVRELPSLAALPWLEAAGLIKNLEFHLVRRTAYQGTASLAEGWVERELASLRRLATHLRPPSVRRVVPSAPPLKRSHPRVRG